MSSFGRLRLLAYNYRIRISDCVFVFSIFCCCCILIKVVAKDVLQCLHSVVKGRWQLVGTQIFWGPPSSFFSVFVIATVVIIIIIIINSDNPCGMTCLSFSKTGGSQITMANHVSRPIALLHPAKGRGGGDTQILTRILWTEKLWKYQRFLKCNNHDSSAQSRVVLHIPKYSLLWWNFDLKHVAISS